ncbi:MAG: hypothetical protein WDK95_10445 [Syntrophorhabdaceae bacterium]
MVLNHILDRDFYLENIEEIQEELKVADKNLKEALQNTTPEWKEEIIKGAIVCGVKSDWWQNIVKLI